jgi:hypothetical protein
LEKCPCCEAALVSSAEAPRLVAPAREGDLYCADCEWLVGREAVSYGDPDHRIICPKHEDDIPAAERLPVEHTVGISTHLLDSEELLETFGEEGIPKPLQLVWTLVLKASGEPEYRDIPLAELVLNPEDPWDLEELAAMLEGHGVSNVTRYPTVGWAEIRLMRTGPEGMLIHGPTVMSGYVAYVRYVDQLRDWRIWRIGDFLDAAELPTDL